MKLGNLLLCVFVLFTSAGCMADDMKPLHEQTVDSDTIWLQIQFNVPKDEEKIETYYYYARVKKEVYEAIINGKVDSGMILLRDVRYWSTKADKYRAYEDDEFLGELAFRIEHVVRINVMKGDPLDEVEEL